MQYLISVVADGAELTSRDDEAAIDALAATQNPPPVAA